MCGINKGQFRLGVAQVDDALALAQQWLEQLHHLADTGGLTEPSRELAQATVMLGEARARLEKAAADQPGRGDGVTVEAV
ncbi:MAG: hypothetical protein IBX62_03855 [Coriobacteriia bacterium]|nr:hypothetical protein [Coriobacteriia bacterium]